MGRIRFTIGGLLVAGCSVAAGASDTNGEASNASQQTMAAADGGDTSGCSLTSGLRGASYDLTKTKFPFGGASTPEGAGGSVRVSGANGVVAIFSDGSEDASLNAGAPVAVSSDWSTDISALSAHSISYWESMGVPACQITTLNQPGSMPDATSGSLGTAIILDRSFAGITIVESSAWAHFNASDQTTAEGFYWPEIPAATVSAALAFTKVLADPAGLAAFKAKLPADFQGVGTIFIHHTSAGSMSAFRAIATYDVQQSSGEPFAGQEASFDADGNQVSLV